MAIFAQKQVIFDSGLVASSWVTGATARVRFPAAVSLAEIFNIAQKRSSPGIEPVISRLEG